MQNREVIKRMKQYALNNYSNGGDAIYETWDNEYYLEFFNESPETWKPRMQELFEIHEERRMGYER